MPIRGREGFYTPENLEKYVGDAVPVKYRSSWELSTFKFLDNNPNVIYWSYESIQIRYMKPMPNGLARPATYFPDIYVEFVNKAGEYKKELIEIKPKKQTKKSRSKNIRTKMFEDYTLAVNTAKWTAAKRWCASKGDIVFKVFTETSIFG